MTEQTNPLMTRGEQIARLLDLREQKRVLNVEVSRIEEQYRELEAQVLEDLTAEGTM